MNVRLDQQSVEQMFDTVRSFFIKKQQPHPAQFKTMIAILPLPQEVIANGGEKEEFLLAVEAHMSILEFAWTGGDAFMELLAFRMQESATDTQALVSSDQVQPQYQQAQSDDTEFQTVMASLSVVYGGEVYTDTDTIKIVKKLLQASDYEFAMIGHTDEQDQFSTLVWSECYKVRGAR